MENYAYPKANYDFDYKGQVDNKYSLDSLGISNAPTIGQFRRNIRSLGKIGDALMMDPIPAKDTYIDPGQTPYSRFRSDYPEESYPTSGNYSSSYFVQSGFCPVVSAKSREDCLGRDPKYTWIPDEVQIPSDVKGFFSKTQTPESGSCYKPRYSYVNNANDDGLFEGLIPGIIKDVSDLNPSNFFRTLEGKTIPGSNDRTPPRFQLLPCVQENFIGNKNLSLDVKISLIIISLIILIFYFAYSY